MNFQVMESTDSTHNQNAQNFTNSYRAIKVTDLASNQPRKKYTERLFARFVHYEQKSKSVASLKILYKYNELTTAIEILRERFCRRSNFQINQGSKSFFWILKPRYLLNFTYLKFKRI